VILNLGAHLFFESNWIWSVNIYIYNALNGLAGQSWYFDALIGSALSSNLIKAGVIGACFMYAWLAGKDAVEISLRRKILLITLVSSIFALATTKSLSKAVFLPRPFILAEKTFHLEGEQLVETPRLEYMVADDDDTEKGFLELKRGKIEQNDMGSFPSDHAGFFFTIALGIFLAYRRVGMIALAWAICVPLAAKMVLGQHYPLDILVGAGVGTIILFTLQFLFRRLGDRVLSPITDWTMAHSALSAALMFVVLFEVSNTLDGVRKVGKLGKDVAKHMVGRPN
jgi:membrane-associated phospholipid phosphatase